MTRRPLIALVALGLAATTCTGQAPEPEATPSPPAEVEPSPTTDEEPEGAPAGLVALPGGAPFATLVDVPLIRNEPAYEGPRTPKSLEGVHMVDFVRAQVQDPAVSEAMTGRGFAVVPDDLRQFFHAYPASYEHAPVYVTTDTAYHVWHQVFDKALRDTEQRVLLPKLEELVGGLLTRARKQAAELQGTSLEDDADRVLQLVQVAAAPLELETGELGPLARRELALISEHSEIGISPVIADGTGAEGCLAAEPGCTDYTLFTPRGHYTRTPALTRYFLGMSALGQYGFEIDVEKDPGPLCLGILTTRTLLPRGTESGGRLYRLWRQIYEPTAFLVGLADDYTPMELARAVEDVSAGGLSDPLPFEQEAMLADVAASLEAARRVQIDPEGADVRIMGTRFVIDSFVLDQLVYPNVGDEESRWIASPLDLAAALGNKHAYRIQDEAGETEYANYDSQLRKMRRLLARRELDDWAATVYDSWLWALQPVWTRHGKAFPDYMRTKAWTAKSLQTGLGSYAELKHDTILYQKQFLAEGGNGAPPGWIRHWVEPDPVAFMRLAAVAGLMADGLTARGLLTEETSGLLADAIELFDFLGRVAQDELAGNSIGVEDSQRIGGIASLLESFYWRTGEQASTGEPETDDDAAIVADIGRGQEAIIEVGTGRIDRIFVLVPDAQGAFEVAMGGVYSYYEFTTDQQRLTDEEWRQMLEEGRAPARPSWQRQFVVGL